MKIAIIGLPQTGKKTLFELLTANKPSEKDLASGRPIKGVAEIKDPRFDKLIQIYKPKKEVRARIEIEFLPKLDKESIAKGDIFKELSDADAVCHIVRAFRDDAIYHISGSVDARRDIEEVNSQFILYDLIFVEKRLENIEKLSKKGADGQDAKDKGLLLKLKAHLEGGLPIRLLDLTQDEKKIMVNYPFLTQKDMIVVLNVSEDDVANASFIDGFKKEYSKINLGIMQVCAKAESEIAALELPEERKEFLAALGIEEPAIDVLTRVLLKALNLISFFTTSSSEVRQWNIKAGSSAPEAAGAIHSDMERGFIRAEVIKYDDLIALGSEEKVKEAGKFYLKGKDYIVEDADILTMRFNV